MIRIVFRRFLPKLEPVSPKEEENSWEEKVGMGDSGYTEGSIIG